MKKLLQVMGEWIWLRFRSRASLEAEVIMLRQQLGILRRRAPKRVRPDFWFRLILVTVYRLFPSVLDAVHIVQPTTLVRWHRQRFKAYWRWKSRPAKSRATVPHP
jgi:hypothetical protein